MIPELGQLSLILALWISVALATLPMIGSFMGHAGLMAIAKPLANSMFLCVGISYVSLTWSFISGDYSLLYVAQTSNSNLPLAYKITGVWGGHEGSILFWVLILAAWTSAVAVLSKAVPSLLLSRVLSVLGMISVGFLLFVLLTSNPFEKQFPIPNDGASLNPLLQDPGMIIHPPMLYMGYVGFAVAFAFAIAALLGGRLDTATLRWMRPWTNVAWMFLTIGISLGSFWAYYELGWGGWWFWDPVENASFMPWLAGTALMHSLAASEKRGVFKPWTALLAILTFSLSLLGTFLVRSGVLTSVHSFAADPERGRFILIFLLIVVGGSLLLYAIRANQLRSTANFELVSRESALLLNNVLLVVACSAVLLGTLYPLIIDALNLGKISVGSQYFNTVFVPLMLPIVLLVGVGSILNWKRDRLRGRSTSLCVLAIASLLVGTVLSFGFEQQRVVTAAAISLSLWVASSVLFGIVYRFRNKRDRLTAVTHTPAAFWGMNVAHLGVGVFTLGIALTSIHSEEHTVRMSVGESHTIGNYTFSFNQLETNRGANYSAITGVFHVLSDDKTVTELRAEKRIYDVRRDTMTEAGIDGGITRDLFVALGERLNDSGVWSIRLYVKPYIRWIWMGTLFMAIGGLLAAADRRYRTVNEKNSLRKSKTVNHSPAVGNSIPHYSGTNSFSTSEIGKP